MFNKPKEIELMNEITNKPIVCPVFDLTEEIKEYVNQFNSDEEFLRKGGLSTEMLDRLAFGFADIDITTLNPNQLSIKWKEDLENVKYEIQKSGLNPKVWASKVDLTEPIDVSYERNKFFIEDGHHRFVAAKVLNKPLNVNLEIKANPITKIAPKLGYDDVMRCIFKQVKGNVIKEDYNTSKTLTVYHGTKPKFVNTIKQEGLIDKRGYNQGWYVVSTDFESALFHSHPDTEGGDVYVIEFKIPVEDNDRWLGYPYLWKGSKMTDNSTWFALMQKLPSNFINKVHKVSYNDFMKQKNNGFKKINEITNYPTETKGNWYGDEDYESRGGKIVYMTPDEFLSKAAPLEIDNTSRDNIDDLKNHILSGRKLDPLALYTLDKTNPRNSDGRHRAVAAKELGIKKVPVIIFGKQSLTESNSQLEDTFIKINSPNIKSHIDSLINKYGDKAETMLYIKNANTESDKPEYSISYIYCKKIISLSKGLTDKHGQDKEQFELYGGFPLINYLTKELNNKRDVISRSKKTKTMAGFNNQYNKEHQRVGLIKNGKKYVDRNLREHIELIKESETKVNKEASCIVLLNDNKEILLLKRSDKTTWEPGKWSLVGGKIDLGENAEQAAIRECGEETGLAIKGNKLIYCFTMKEDDYEVNFFIGVSEGSDVRLNGEHTEYKWCKPNDILELETVPNLLGEIKKSFETLESSKEETVINEEMSSPSGLALYKAEGSKLFILYNPKTITKALKDYDTDEAEKSIYGVIELRYNSSYDTYEVERVTANKGFGPIMYLVALQFAGSKGLTPTRIKNQVSDAAKNIWKQFYDGVGAGYVKNLDLINAEDGTQNTSHNEEYLNKKYILNKTYSDYNKMLNTNNKFLQNDKYGEMGDVIHDAGDVVLTRKMREIY